MRSDMPPSGDGKYDSGRSHNSAEPHRVARGCPARCRLTMVSNKGPCGFISVLSHVRIHCLGRAAMSCESCAIATGAGPRVSAVFIELLNVLTIGLGRLSFSPSSLYSSPNPGHPFKYQTLLNQLRLPSIATMPNFTSTNRFGVLNRSDPMLIGSHTPPRPTTNSPGALQPPVRTEYTAAQMRALHPSALSHSYTSQHSGLQAQMNEAGMCFKGVPQEPRNGR